MQWMHSFRLWVGIVAALVGCAVGRAAHQRAATQEAVVQTAKIFDATTAYFMEENVPRGSAAVPGGVRDIGYARASSVQPLLHLSLSPEGLLAEHALPLSGERPCDEMLCVGAEAMHAKLPSSSEVDLLALVAFESAATVSELRAEPLHLVIALDRSSSMGGTELDVARAGIRAALGRLHANDRVSLVTFADDVVVERRAVSGDAVGAVIGPLDGVEAIGTTNLEAGLREAYSLARQEGGRARVLLVTDERPTVGAVEPRRFMDLVQWHAEDGIGLSIIGVGRDYGIDLARTMAAAPHASVSYVSDAAAATALLGERFDSVITEVARDIELTIHPAPGLRVARVFGVPEAMVLHEGGGSARVRISSLFASEQRGGIVVAFSATQRVSGSIAAVDLDYRDAGGNAGSSRAKVELVEGHPQGLARAHALVDEITTIEHLPPRACVGRKASDRLSELRGRLESLEDVALQKEIGLIDRLRATSCHEARPKIREAWTPSVRERPFDWSLIRPLFHALIGFISGFGFVTMLQHLRRSITVRIPRAPAVWTLAAIVPILALAAWLGHHGVTQIERVAAFAGEVEGFGVQRGYDEVAAVRTKAMLEVAGAIGLMALALVIGRLGRQQPSATRADVHDAAR